MWTLLAGGMLALFCTVNPGRAVKICTGADTILLYKKDTLLITGTVPTVLACHFGTNRTENYSSRLKILLLLENPKVATMPEGVYELYITSQPPDINNLSPSQPGFVNVLDLYSITAPAANNRLEIDISEHIKKLFLLKQPLPSAFISIRFGPIKFSDGSYSSKAGELHLSGIRMVQIKN